MKLTANEIEWLESHLPGLQYESSSSKIVGELDIRTAYNRESGELRIGDHAREMARFIYDVFEIEIHLANLDENGWPKVYEVGGRYHQIAKKCNVEVIDLHINPDDSTCCLSLKYGGNRNFHIKDFLPELVIPFFYQLSYTEKFGIDASRNDLWGEYSHGEKGRAEYEVEMLNLAKHQPNRNDLCPCGSDKKYKKCHMDQVEAVKRRIRETTPDAITRRRP